LVLKDILRGCIDKTYVLRYPIERYLIDGYLRKGKDKVIDMKKEPWISANEAAQIISENSGKPVHPDYVRLLARQNPKKLASKPLDGRTNVYLRTDVEKIKVKAKNVKNKAENVEKPSVSVESTSISPLQGGTEGHSDEMGHTEETSEDPAA
jgi:hypothetical protein